jgi:zinc transporter 1
VNFRGSFEGRSTFDYATETSEVVHDTPFSPASPQFPLVDDNELSPLLAQHRHSTSDERDPNGQSHSRVGSMNMRALVLHVLGDALGNVGVIATGLIIWQTTWSFKYYFDPIISLVITVIIFSSALPLGMFLNWTLH